VEEGLDLGGHKNPHGLQPGRLRCGAPLLRGQTKPKRITVFTDAQAAIRRMVSGEPGPGQQYPIQARKHIDMLRRARPGIIIEIRWRPPHKGVAGNEKGDKWAKIAAEEPDTWGVEWMSYLDRLSMSLPRSLAHLKREISEKKWEEARQWAGGRTSEKKYRMPKFRKPDGTVAESSKRLASRFYQPKTDHARIGQSPHWDKFRPTAQNWWCQGPARTRDHHFKVRPKRKRKQKILWAEVRKETGGWQSRWKIRDLFADLRCSQAVLDFLSATDVRSLAPAAEEDGTGSGASEWELRERW